jgi:hypothetical protein
MVRINMTPARDLVFRLWWRCARWYGSTKSVFEVGVVQNAAGYSTLLVRRLVNLTMNCCGTSSCSATESLQPMFAPNTQELSARNAELSEFFGMRPLGATFHQGSAKSCLTCNRRPWRKARYDLSNAVCLLWLQ